MRISGCSRSWGALSVPHVKLSFSTKISCKVLFGRLVSANKLSHTVNMFGGRGGDGSMKSMNAHDTAPTPLSATTLPVERRRDCRADHNWGPGRCIHSIACYKIKRYNTSMCTVDLHKLTSICIYICMYSMYKWTYII